MHALISAVNQCTWRSAPSEVSGSSLWAASKLKHRLQFKGAVRLILFASLLPIRAKHGAYRGTSGGLVSSCVVAQ